ncbi:NRDE-2, necessary for RNA interference-domain-containing protein [Xylariales sp. AK1849]|nr:NRDE-2, necessary for RNA interference-domain-containing protein [Xylariales sp. AK1849]
MSTKGGPKSGVPKFSSFKRRPEDPSASEERDHRAKELKSGEGHIRGKSRTQEEYHRSSVVHRSRHSGNRDLKDERATSGSFHVSQRPAPAESNDLFMVDKRGDALIRRYGGNNRYDVPGYRRIGAGRLLGADDFFRTERIGNREEFFLRGFGEGGSALGRDRRSLLAKVGRNTTGPVRVRAEKSQVFLGTEDFLPLRQSKKRKLGDSQSHRSSGEDEPSYRSIHGMSKKHQHSDSDEAYSSDSSNSSTSSFHRDLDPVKLRGVELSGKVRDHPHNIDIWIDLVDHQDVLLGMSEHEGRQATQAEVKSYADIKLSMLEKALTHAQTLDQTERLHLRIMHEGSKLWNQKTLAQRWEDLVKDYGASPGIWLAYVTFRQTSLSTVRYEDIKQLYVDRLRTIELALAEQVPDSPKQARYDELVVIFSRMTRFIADAGFAELAAAAWQATLELNICRPPSLTDGCKDSHFSSFQRFWESEVARFGDESAKGWAAFEQGGCIEEAPEPKSFDVHRAPSTRDPYKAWAAVEVHRSRSARVPARTMDDGTEDDPYRVIMFGDVEDLLVFIPTQALSMARHQLLDAFLIFYQLPPVFGTDKATETILQDELLNGGSNEPFSTGDDPEQDRINQISTDGAIKPPEIRHQYQMMAKSLDVLFPSQDWFGYMGPFRETMTSEQYRLVSKTLKQLSLSFSGTELAPYRLAFENLNSENDSKKTAKALLKQNPTNAELYIGFSMTELAKGNIDAARNVASASLSLSAIPPHDKLHLYITWAWMELEDNQLAKALARLCLVSEDTPSVELASPAQILKSRQLMASNRDQSLSSRDSEAAVAYAEGLALLEYLTKNSGKEPQSGAQGDIWSAIISIASCSEDLRSRGLVESPAHERLLQFAARLLYYHAIHGPYRPGFFRKHVAGFIDFFPQNTMFLSLYAWRDKRLSISDRVRSTLDKIVLVKAHDCVSSRVFAIRHEMTTGNVHSTGAAFERALESEKCRHHPGIWISYIRYCHSRRALRPKAKDVFYRAVQSCPWSKDIFMEAFISLGRDMDSSELRSVYNTLCEKGLRVHVELEEFVEQWKQAGQTEATARRNR